MTKLRKRMIEDMKLNGLSQRTQECYLNAVSKIAKYYMKAPNAISPEEIRRYFLRLVKDEVVTSATLHVYRAGIRFLFEKTLRKDWGDLKLIRPRIHRKLPDVLTVEEVKSILGTLRDQKYRLCLKVIYACGLRISEGCEILAANIDSARHALKIVGRKGKKDRFVPIPDVLLEELRDYWRAYRPATYLFFGATKDRPLCDATLRRAFNRAVREVGIKKDVSVHALRHSYATHMLEAGIDLRSIQEVLGHCNLETTLIYTHLTERTTMRALTVMNDIMASQ
jgi:integrase/recombinase XerD